MELRSTPRNLVKASNKLILAQREPPPFWQACLTQVVGIRLVGSVLLSWLRPTSWIESHAPYGIHNTTFYN